MYFDGNSPAKGPEWQRPYTFGGATLLLNRSDFNDEREQSLLSKNVNSENFAQ